MGDRANIVVQTGTRPTRKVFLYTHWGGASCPRIVRDALAAGRDRWTDPTYLARIVFSHMIPEKCRLETTGFGIDTVMGDNENPVLYLNTTKQKVELLDYEGYDSSNVKWHKPIGIWSFEEFAKMPDDVSFESLGYAYE